MVAHYPENTDVVVFFFLLLHKDGFFPPTKNALGDCATASVEKKNSPVENGCH